MNKLKSDSFELAHLQGLRASQGITSERSRRPNEAKVIPLSFFSLDYKIDGVVFVSCDKIEPER